MVKAVFFDLDGTLLDRDASVKQFIAAQYDRLTVHLSHIPKIDYITRFIELDCRGHVWKDKVYQMLVAEFEIERMSWQALLEDYETQFQLHCVPFNFLFEMLNVLKQQGYLLGIVTNGLGQFQTRSIEGLGIRDYFDIILISEIEQVRKPQAEIFQRAMTRLGVSAPDSVFVGDHPEADIAGAKRVQMRTIWKRSLHWLEAKEADAIIDELSEIPLILEQFKCN
ncbi:HAD family hydrolase [Chlorogloeopsis fritschii PCC 9212]|uniref:Haloacid dehalogenase n=2 Tax=Chlorogloeopsis fritschii TaxID=1124 RepID=A0A3S1A973_CHLFR|nr:HAD-IA family hydrolase [Chlorogloeopsis fritschii]RUR72801.1 haloacid dehalogenase [Chlorogloeopsis fritschii PCC 6912]